MNFKKLVILGTSLIFSSSFYAQSPSVIKYNKENKKIYKEFKKFVKKNGKNDSKFLSWYEKDMMGERNVVRRYNNDILIRSDSLDSNWKSFEDKGSNGLDSYNGELLENFDAERQLELAKKYTNLISKLMDD